MPHKFSIGQTVVFMPRPGELTSKSEAVIERLLPSDGTEFQYHIRTVPDGTERRVGEGQLRQT